MTSTRQRQQTPNGTSRSTPKPSVRSVSGPASSSVSTTRAAQLPANRPTVKSLAQRFNHPSSVESSPPAARARTSRTASSARSITEPLAPPAPMPSSPARPTKEAAYGSYKFNNLKPRERPQPAPATPASMRRSNDRTSREEQTTPSRRKLSSPTRGQAPQRMSTGRQPFFGEVVGEHDEMTPGYGISGAEPVTNDVDPITATMADKSTIKLVDGDSQLSPKAPFLGHTPVQHRRTSSEMTPTSAGDVPPGEQAYQRERRRISPPSKIPIATRRMSAASDSSSSTTSLKFNSAGPGFGYHRTSPNRSAKRSNISTQQLLPAVSYRGYRERGKSPQGARIGTSLAAVITAPPPPPSPRLRHSYERQLLPHEIPESTVRAVDVHDHQDYFQDGGGPGFHHESRRSPLDKEQEGRADTVNGYGEDGMESPSNRSRRAQQSPKDYNANVSHAHQQLLAVHTSSLLAPQIPAPLSATTDFEQDESPILGMPGSFMTTPPIAPFTLPVGAGETHANQSSPAAPHQSELLQAHTFQPLRPSRPTDVPSSEIAHTAPSELGIRESIPIMLGADEQQPEWAGQPHRSRHSPRLSIGAHKWRLEPLDSSGTISYLDEDDSPIDPFANRESLRPDDSASVAFYRPAERRNPDWTPKMPAMSETRRMTMDSEAYNVINRVLNLYHQSTVISAEVAYDAQRKVHSVSPMIAQHQDWGSKEATETYLARLLSDATVTEAESGNVRPIAAENSMATNHRIPSLSIRELDEDPSEPDAGGTAIIFPPESRRYSRGSPGSTTTTIWDDGSRADSFSVNLTRDSARSGDDFTQAHLPSSTYAPNPPSKDWQHIYNVDTSHSAGPQSRASPERSTLTFGSLLPEIEGAGEGLGLSLHAGQQQQQNHQHQHHHPQPNPTINYPQPPRPCYSPPPPPPRPGYSPPLPPAQASIDHTVAITTTPPPHTSSVYNWQPPSGILPSTPLTNKMGPSNSPEALDNAPNLRDSVNQKDADTGHQGLASEVLVTDVTGTASASRKSDTPSQNSSPISQELKTRYRILEELIASEQSFCVDMMLTASCFEATASEVMTPKDVRTLFCNSQDIDKFSHGLVQALKRAARPITNPAKSPGENPKTLAAMGASEADSEPSLATDSDEPWDEFKFLTVENDKKTTIGQVMNEYLPRMERLFTSYLLNHGDASELIKSKSEDPQVLAWVKACFQYSKDLTNAWDLDSLLVKPVQRVMKYPLLLESLEKATPPDHPDFLAIQAARKETVEINLRINQARNRQETLREATKEGKKQKNKGLLDNRLGKTFFVKPFQSKADRSNRPTGAALAFSDDDYDFLSQKFGGHFFQIQVVIRDIEAYLDTMTEFMTNTNCLVLTFIALLESAPSSHLEIESMWRRQALAFFDLQSIALEDHKATVHQRVLKPILELWGLHGRPQKLMEQRKKGLAQYVKFKQASDRRDKLDPKLEEAGQSFQTINSTLKEELPKLYELTKKCVRACLGSFVSLQRDWWRNCQKKILPLLEIEPEHTTSIVFDLKAYVDRFHSDFASVEAVADRLAIANRSLLQDIHNNASPLPTYTEDGSSRKSSSRRTESISSDASMLEHKKRYSGGYNSQRNQIFPPRSSAAIQASLARERAEHRMGPGSDRSDVTVTHHRGKAPAHYGGHDGAFDSDHGLTSSMASSLLSPTSNPGSSRTSGVFNSALPMSDSGFHGAREEAPTTPATPTDPDEPEVLFLAASLFEFNIAHDRREGGIPYLVYVPGEIFDVIGMKGELWLARNQDDTTRTVGWIWEKHFARILPEDG